MMNWIRPLHNLQPNRKIIGLHYTKRQKTFESSCRIKFHSTCLNNKHDTIKVKIQRRINTKRKVFVPVLNYKSSIMYEISYKMSTYLCPMIRLPLDIWLSYLSDNGVKLSFLFAIKYFIRRVSHTKKINFAKKGNSITKVRKFSTPTINVEACKRLRF